MAIYNSEYLKSLASQKQRIFEQRQYNVRNTPLSTQYDIFLSHSYLDKQVVQGLYQELTDFGYNVYVDWIVDTDIDRNNVTKDSAKRIQYRLKASKSLLLAISTNSAMSKWMPWELGYVDGHTNKCAIIPVSLEKFAPKSFKGTEYLSLYPFIKKAPTAVSGDKLWVIESEYKYSTFESWSRDGKLAEENSVNIFNL